MGKSSSTSGREAEAPRERLRGRRLRLLQVWVADTRTPEFAAEALRQSRAVAASPHADADQAFVEAVSIDW